MEKNNQTRDKAIRERRRAAAVVKGGRKAAGNFIIQGSILAIAGIIVRLIGMVYRIPLINIIGKEGNGYYTAAYDIYVIL